MGLKNFWVKNFLGKKKFGVKKNWVKNFFG